MDFTDPRTARAIVLRLRDEFKMTDQRFGRLHHFFHRQPENIANFVAYCEKTGRFRVGGSNETTAQRLALALERLEAGASWTEAERVALERHPVPRR